MSDTPTYASLITRLFSGSANDRAAVLAHLGSHPADAHAVEAAVRDHLRSKLGWVRLVAADAVLRVYGDVHAVLPSVGAVLRAGGMAWTADDAFTLLRAIGGEVARIGGPDPWKELLDASPAEATPALLIGLAKAAPRAPHDFATLAPAIRAFLAVPSLRVAAGAALWRVTWRVNRAWLAALNPADEVFARMGLRALVTDVLLEHLGRRPDLADLIRDFITTFPGEAGAVVVAQLSRLGSRGWGVLVPMLNPDRGPERRPVPDAVRKAILIEAGKRPTVLPLIHHHAHAVIAGAANEGETNDLVPLAARVLTDLGPAAGMAIPDLLNLAIRVPATGSIVAATVTKLAPGFPNATAAIVRALHRIRSAVPFGPKHATAFEALAGALAELDPDLAPTLAESTSLDPRVPDLLLQQPGWKAAAPEVRRRHARALANLLGSPRAEVRGRAAELLRHYRDELPAVWPALVAVLAGSDEKTAAAVLPHFRHLESAADAVTPELRELFQEKNPAYAARAVIALWRLGRLPEITAAFREAVEASDENGWGWTVLRGVVDRVSKTHASLADLNEVFAAAPAAVAEKVAALLNPPEPVEEKRITACLPQPNLSNEVNWDGLQQAVGNDGGTGALMFLALLCEYGSAGVSDLRLWLIKSHRELTGASLVQSKAAVDRVIETLARPAPTSRDRREAVYRFFPGRAELPAELVKLAHDRVGWFRWAALELADNWGLTPEQARDLTADGVWDANPRVRERALRMVRG
jgi:hypothetical protein